MMTLPAIRFSARVIPIAKARHRSFAFTDKSGHARSRQYMPANAAKAESEFIALADPHAPPKPFEGPVLLNLCFRLPIPISRPQWWRDAALIGDVRPIGKPDLDNLVKLVMDAMTRSGRWWLRDEQVVGGAWSKFYADAPETAVEVIPGIQREAPMRRGRSAAAQPDIFADSRRTS